MCPGLAKGSAHCAVMYEPDAEISYCKFSELPAGALPSVLACARHLVF